jgi:ribonuclease HII
MPSRSATRPKPLRTSTPLYRLAANASVTAATAKQRMLKQLICSDAPEQALRYRGVQVIAGVDEVGRGALFGPVVAAAVILPECMSGLAEAGLRDSKQLTAEHRESLDIHVRRLAIAVSISEVDAETIDSVNIYQATRLAMRTAVEGLSIAPEHLLIDAMRLDHPCPQTRLFYGDSLSLSIAAASVVAKVYRDRLMCLLDSLHPKYGLASHKGYATPEHRRALAKHGPTPLHRRSFAPVAASSSAVLDPDATLAEQMDGGWLGDFSIEEPELELDETLLPDSPAAMQEEDAPWQ